jgi:branched-chain amino acid aminotransferase
VAEWAEWVWLNGARVRSDEASVSVFDRSFLMGDGLFETMRASRSRVFRIDRHLARLQAGAARLRLTLPWTTTELTHAIQETLAANGLGDAAVRLTVSRGIGSPGPGLAGADTPLVVVAVRAFAGYPRHWYDPGATAVLSTVTKNERSPLCGLKCTSYAEHILARAEAGERQADEALLLNTRGHLVEASSANLFVVIEGILYTPDLGSGCLPGITRAAVLELARRADVPIREAHLFPSLRGGWDEAFLTNSLLGVAPLSQVEGSPIRSGRPGPITLKLAEELRHLVASEDSPPTGQ